MPDPVRRAAPCTWACLLLLAAQAATAQVNDNWANRTAILALPFAAAEAQIAQATREATDLEPVCTPPGSNPISNTLWYGYTAGPATEYLTLEATNTNPAIAISVYTGAPGAFRLETGGCGLTVGGVGNARIAGLRLRPNTSYSIMLGSMFPVGGNPTLNFEVRAATRYAVTKTADTADGDCDADCSLREAVLASNAAPGAVVIPAGTYPLTLAGPSENGGQTGDLDLLVGMGVYGAGMGATAIDGVDLDRVLDVNPTFGFPRSTFILGDLALINGNVLVGQAGQTRGAGIHTMLGSQTQYLALERVRLTGNRAGESGGGAFIGSVASIRDSAIDGNAANFSGAGLGLFGGPNLQEVDGSSISGNTSNQDGGGIQAQGRVWIANSTISGNSTRLSGGGINASGGHLQIASTTIVRNAVTINNPFATNVGGGIRMESDGPNHRFVNTVIADNTVPAPGDPADCVLFDRAIDTLYNHVIQPGSCGFTGTGDVTGVPAGYDAALADNGGPTRTHKVPSDSPLVDSADPAGCNDAAGVPLAFDQRGTGFPRILGAACDKGAYEGLPNLIFLSGFEDP